MLAAHAVLLSRVMPGWCGGSGPVLAAHAVLLSRVMPGWCGGSGPVLAAHAVLLSRVMPGWCGGSGPVLAARDILISLSTWPNSLSNRSNVWPVLLVQPQLPPRTRTPFPMLWTQPSGVAANHCCLQPSPRRALRLMPEIIRLVVTFCNCVDTAGRRCCSPAGRGILLPVSNGIFTFRSLRGGDAGQ